MSDLDARVAALMEYADKYADVCEDDLAMSIRVNARIALKQALRAELQKPALHEPLTDPCPQCTPGVVCKTIHCGRLRSSELLQRFGTQPAAPGSKTLEAMATEAAIEQDPELAAPVELPVVGWIRGSGLQMLKDGYAATLYVDERDSNNSMALVRLSDAQAAIAAGRKV